VQALQREFQQNIVIDSKSWRVTLNPKQV